MVLLSLGMSVTVKTGAMGDRSQLKGFGQGRAWGLNIDKHIQVHSDSPKFQKMTYFIVFYLRTVSVSYNFSL